MEYKLTVPMQVKVRDEFVSIPVRYSIHNENENVTIYNCTVDLPTDEIPDWLHPHEFSIKKVYSPGVPIGITVRSISPNPMGTLDATSFAAETMDQLLFKETYRTSNVG